MSSPNKQTNLSSNEIQKHDGVKERLIINNTNSTQEYETSRNEESNCFRLSDVGDKVIETVKHGLNTILRTTDKNDQNNQEQHEQRTRPPLAIRSTISDKSSKIVQERISKTEEEYLFVVSRTDN